MSFFEMMHHMMQSAIDNYDVSDLINQVVIGILLFLMVFRLNVRVRFNSQSPYDY